MLDCDAIIFPGVGAFGFGIDALKPRGLDDVIHAAANISKPVLGICRGAQVINVARGGSLYQNIGVQVDNVQGHFPKETAMKSKTPSLIGAAGIVLIANTAAEAQTPPSPKKESVKINTVTEGPISKARQEADAQLKKAIKDSATSEAEVKEFAEQIPLDYEKLTGSTSESVAFATEAPFLQSMGMQTVVMGPGSIDQAHQPDEFIDCSQIEPAIEVIKGLIRNFRLNQT